jgi:hypothetical protein
MTVSTITSASVGTKLATTTDAKVTGLTVAVPTSMADATTQLCLLDAAAAPALVGPSAPLYAASLSDLTPVLFGIKPNIPLTPGMTAPAAPFSVGSFGTGRAFSNGVFVKSCPAGVTFSLTTG